MPQIMMTNPKLSPSLINLSFVLLFLLPAIFFALPSIFFIFFLFLPCLCVSLPPILLSYVMFSYLPIRPLVRDLVASVTSCETKFGAEKIEYVRKEQPESYMVDRWELPSCSESEDGEEESWHDLDFKYMSGDHTKPFEDVMSFWKRKEKCKIS